MRRAFLIALVLAVWSVNGWAGDYNYQAHVKGMVCAFCAYSVGKKIGSLPGVDAESVDVNLESGRVGFASKQPVSRQALESVFTESGFRLDTLDETGHVPAGSGSGQALALMLDMTLDSLDTGRFETVFEAIGNIAAGNPSRLVIEAPASLEGDLLKPVLMGRQQVMKVRFKASDSPSIHLQLYM